MLLSLSGALLLTSSLVAWTSTNIEEVFDDVLMDLTLKGDRPSVILAGRNIYRMYRQAVRDKMTIPLSEGKAGKRMFDLGFEGVHAQRHPTSCMTRTALSRSPTSSMTRSCVCTCCVV